VTRRDHDDDPNYGGDLQMMKQTCGVRSTMNVLEQVAELQHYSADVVALLVIAVHEVPEGTTLLVWISSTEFESF
jgi:hypothetical protein